jgi:hypothetical protein
LLQNNTKSKRIFGYKDGIFETGLYLSGIEDVGEQVGDVGALLTCDEGRS